MFCELNLKNFKAFEELSVDLKPLTFLLGPNNSGKSSIMAPLRMLAQTAESHDAKIPLLLNGIMGDFGTYKDVVYGNKNARHITISFGIDIPAFGKIRTGLTYEYRSALHEVILRKLEVTEGKNTLLMSRYSENTESHIIENIGGREIPSERSEGFLLKNFIADIPSLPQHKIFTSEINDLIKSTYIYPFFQELEYVGAMRIPPSRIYLVSGDRRSRIGGSGEHCINILTMDAMKKPSLKNIFEKVKKWLVRAGMARDMTILSSSDHRYYELRIQHPETGEHQNIADVGYGHSQVMPVLVGGYNTEKGRTFLAEEPEIHLHPRAQAELGDFFLDLYQNRVQSVVETHSEYLVLRLQQHIAKGNISPEDIIFYYVYADKGKKQAVPLNLDQKGRFLEEWPEGFFPERLEEAKQLSKIRFRN